mgnify:CR=1 FL=1
MKQLVPPAVFQSRDWLEAGLLAGLLALCYWIYAAAFGGSFHFDDAPNLHGLGAVRDVESLLTFASAGEAGPLGRPLALLTFGLQAASWPGHPEDFLWVNVFVHLLNGCLLALLVLRVARLFPARVDRPGLLAATAAGLWLLHPLLASTSLLVVQRMASLSATAVLLGLLLYVVGRTRAAASPRTGVLLMAAGILGGTALAVLSKETGALLPLYALVLEGTLLSAARLPQPSARVPWTRILLLGPSFALAAYVALSWSDIAGGYVGRPFTLGERLATQALILWDYVRQILVPSSTRLGPFQDNYAIYGPTAAAALAAIAGWVLAVAAAVAARRRLPLVTFAVGWFLAGHLIESSVLSLELYFEHRNYLPSIGPIVLVAAASFALPEGNRRLAYAALSAYGLLLAGLLLQLTSLWGQPALAAEMWARQRPHSARAVQYLGQQLLRTGDRPAASSLFQGASERNPQASDLALQTLQIDCGQVDAQLYARRLEATLERLPHLRHSYAAIDAVIRLGSMALEQECPDVGPEEVERLAEGLLANPAFQANPRSVHLLHHELARMARHRRDLNSTVLHLEQAFRASPDPETAATIAATLASAGLTTEALASLAETSRFAPKNPFVRAHWTRLLGGVKAAIEGVRSAPTVAG